MKAVGSSHCKGQEQGPVLRAKADVHVAQTSGGCQAKIYDQARSGANSQFSRRVRVTRLSSRVFRSFGRWFPTVKQQFHMILRQSGHAVTVAYHLQRDRE